MSTELNGQLNENNEEKRANAMKEFQFCFVAIIGSNTWQGTAGMQLYMALQTFKFVSFKQLLYI
jgi:hypothetical protein